MMGGQIDGFPGSSVGTGQVDIPGPLLTPQGAPPPPPTFKSRKMPLYLRRLELLCLRPAGHSTDL